MRAISDHEAGGEPQLEGDRRAARAERDEGEGEERARRGTRRGRASWRAAVARVVARRGRACRCAVRAPRSVTAA
ncbi:MAG: hypothetical protein KF901_08035 [Myxococcales bacterium]|nr:hypothetical protein [Myxococcales bacterium]